jgi:hypothetical protein
VLKSGQEPRWFERGQKKKIGCATKIFSRNSPRNHLSMDAPVPVPLFTCDWCHLAFPSMAEMNKHQSRKCKEPKATLQGGLNETNPRNKQHEV